MQQGWCGQTLASYRLNLLLLQGQICVGIAIFAQRGTWNYANRHFKFKISPRIAGIKATQFVSIAPLTTSRSGSTTKKSRASPTTWRDSNTHTTRKSEKDDLRQDLKIQILLDRIRVPKKKHQSFNDKNNFFTIILRSKIRRKNYNENCISKEN